MMSKPRLTLPVADIKQVIVGQDPQEGAVITIEALEQEIELNLPEAVLAKLEAILARARREQANYRGQFIH